MRRRWHPLQWRPARAAGIRTAHVHESTALCMCTLQQDVVAAFRQITQPIVVSGVPGATGRRGFSAAAGGAAVGQHEAQSRAKCVQAPGKAAAAAVLAPGSRVLRGRRIGWAAEAVVRRSSAMSYDDVVSSGSYSGCTCMPGALRKSAAAAPGGSTASACSRRRRAMAARYRRHLCHPCAPHTCQR